MPDVPPAVAPRPGPRPVRRTGSLRRRTALAAGAAAVAALVAVAAPSAEAPAAAGTDTAVVVAAGDIACSTRSPGYRGGAGMPDKCQQRATSRLLGAGVAAVLPLGDLQYERGALADFRSVYDDTWGTVKAKSHPVPGNHEYRTARAAGYFDYWGQRAGPRGRGWYSYDVGKWHLVALNSNCGKVGCRDGSAQVTWLAADLARHRTACTLAYFHSPRWSSGEHGSDPHMADIWRVLSAKGVDVVLSGHDHGYERFAPLSASGARDPSGIRSFVVGTGGRSLQTPDGRRVVGSVVRDLTSFGVLRLTLRPAGYSWAFQPAAGGTLRDAGSAGCH